MNSNMFRLSALAAAVVVVLASGNLHAGTVLSLSVSTEASQGAVSSAWLRSQYPSTMARCPTGWPGWRTKRIA